MNKKTTRNALFFSLISLLLSVSMLVGTTFAWFTDSVNSGINMITAGNLDVNLYHGKDADPSDDVAADTKVFTDENGADILWEPGAVAYTNLKVANEGSLALKYQLAMSFFDENHIVGTGAKLSQILKIGIVDRAITETGRDDVIAAVTVWEDLASFAKYGDLDAGDSKTYGIVIYWQPSAQDNNWNVSNGAEVSDKATTGKNSLRINLGIKLNATQYTAESDSIDDLYDSSATLPVYGSSSAAVAVGTTSVSLTVNDQNTSVNIGAVNVPADALAAGTNTVEVHMSQTDVNANISVSSDEEAATYDISVSGIKENNATPIEVQLFVGKNLTDVKLYHYAQQVDPITYDAATGIVTFTTTSFSPFTAVYKPERPGNLQQRIEELEEIVSALQNQLVANADSCDIISIQDNRIKYIPREPDSGYTATCQYHFFPAAKAAEVYAQWLEDPSVLTVVSYHNANYVSENPIAYYELPINHVEVDNATGILTVVFGVSSLPDEFFINARGTINVDTYLSVNSDTCRAVSDRIRISLAADH